MPTFNDPAADAAEAREPVRALAHASRAFTNLADIYQVIGELLGAQRSLKQVPDQLAAAHIRHQDRGFLDNGDRSGGLLDADAAARALRRASALVVQAGRAVDGASQHSGRIAWHPAPTHDESALDPVARDPFDRHPVTPRRGLSQ